ncbi:MAG: SulP family inorganic anion transporter [Acidimicrobiia bacterium]
MTDRTDQGATGLGRFVPGLSILTRYEKGWFRPDLLAGVTVWAMLVPQALGYSALAGMPSVNGLYAAVGALVLYWLWGSSRELNVGPESTVAIMVATILTPLAASGSEEYVALAATLAILVGLVLLIGGLLRLGRIADFLSRPILAGYVFGSGILIVVSQLPDLLGIDVDSSLYASDIGAVLRNLDQTDLLTLSIGLGTIAIVMVLKRVNRAVPGALVAVVLTTALVWIADLDVETVGEFASGIPIPGIPDVSVDQVVSLIVPAFAISLLVYPDSVLTSRSLSSMNKYRLDANREFFGIGAANVGSGLMAGFPVNGSQSRSFVLSEAGAKSQVSNLWAAAMVLLTLLLLAPLFAYLPTAALAGIVIIAGFGLLGLSEFRILWNYRRIEFWMGVGTIAAVLILGMLGGIIVAVALSLLEVVMRASSPETAELGRVPGTDTYRDIEDHANTETFPGLYLYRFDAPLFFANASKLRDDIGDAVADPDAEITDVVIDAESMYDVDSTGAQILLELLDALDDDGIGLSFARLRTELRDEMEAAGVDQRLAGAGIYLEVDDAVEDYLIRSRGARPGSDPSTT